MKNLNSVLFYTLEKAIKTYRQFAQRELKRAGLSITVDQWLTLKCIYDHPEISQKDLATMVFKDTASITRIIDLLEKANYLKKAHHKSDKRKSNIVITPLGLETIEFAEEVVDSYRKTALKGIGIAKEKHVNAVLKTIIHNCQ